MSAMLVYALQALLLPPVSLLVLALVGLAYGNRKWGRNMALTGLILLWLLSLPVVVNRLGLWWERVPPVTAEAVAASKPQALVVIGGGLQFDTPEYPGQITLHPRNLLRLRYAAKLAWDLGLPVLVSGGGALAPDDVAEADLMAEILDREFKTPVAWQERESRNTAENAGFSRELLRQYGIDNIVLVTQAYHMPRALMAFRNAGFKVLPAPTAFIGRSGDSRFLDWLPSPSAWANVFLLAHEAVGMVWYGIRYG
ncbi:YdcF family protein [Methylomonas koyamae]|uniref:YdcF family protein n=1 Tax=Methylomonas koyamae TaxID=702114 RepID=UPI001C33B437|nr:YdcF family protein [Methylomonas koyamae]BBL57307.1 hypothetical protein MKFW12EY_09200 [Methylomonas koyamae]